MAHAIQGLLYTFDKPIVRLTYKDKIGGAWYARLLRIFTDEVGEYIIEFETIGAPNTTFNHIDLIKFYTFEPAFKWPTK